MLTSEDHKKTKKELDQTKRALRDITNSIHIAERQRDVLQKQAGRLKKRYTSKICDYNELEAVLEEAEETNSHYLIHLLRFSKSCLFCQVPPNHC